MKKIYQMPETDVVTLRVTGIIMEGTENSGTGHIIQANESSNFDEGELSTETNNSSLWDD